MKRTISFNCLFCIILDKINKIESDGQGHDGLSVYIIKVPLSSTFLYLTHIVNDYQEKGYFSKSGNRLFSKGSDLKKLNYLRAISLLATISKILKKNSKEQISQYLENHQLFPKKDADDI